jgi:alpha-glucosidase
MMADNPTAYQKEQESTDFIAAVPTTFDETVALDGKVGEYVAIARRKGSTWHIGAMTNWDARIKHRPFFFRRRNLQSGNF